MFWNVRIMNVTIVMISVAVCGLAGAQTVTWDGDAADGDWFNPVNWSDDTYPDANLDLLVTDGTPTTAEEVMVDDGGSLELNSSDANVSFDALYIGQVGQGILTAGGGAGLNSMDSYIGFDGNSQGMVNLTDNAQWNADRLYVGYSGNGVINAQFNSHVNAPNEMYIGYGAGGSGEVNLLDESNFNTAVLHVGYEGTGTVQVSGGSELQIQSSTYIGTESGSDGSVTIDGGADLGYVSSFNQLTVGQNGHGQLHLQNGVEAFSRYTDIGMMAWGEGEVTVDGEGTLWNINNNFFIGNNGSGSLAITGGGMVESHDSWIARGPAASGHVTVDGAGSTWMLDNLTIYEGNGSLTVTHGGQVEVAQNITMADYSGASGRITVEGDGSLLTAEDLTAGSESNSPYGYGVGHVDVYDGAVIEIDNMMTFRQNSTLNVDGGTVETKGLKLQNPSKLRFTGGMISIGSGGLQFVNQDDQPLVVSGESGDSAALSLVDGGQLGHLEEMVIGRSGAGQLMLAGQAWIDVQRVYLGEQVGGLGSVMVDEGSAMQTGELVVGVRGGGSIQAANAGHINTISLVVGQDAGSQGQIVLDGANTSGEVNTELNVTGTQNSQLLEVGRHGDGRVQVVHGAVMNSKFTRIGFGGDSQGEIIINGDGSSWTSNSEVIVGYFGNARFELSDGAKANFNNNTIVGQGLGGWGEVLVTGTGSSWTSNSEVVVGEYGSGEVNVEDGGRVVIQGLFLGREVAMAGSSLGEVYVSGAGSQMVVDGEMTVGERGSGFVTVTDGGELASGTTYVGRYVNSRGEVTVSGADSLWTCDGYLLVGSNYPPSEAAVTVSDGGQLNVSSDLEVYNNSRLAIHGGKVTAYSVIFPDNAGLEFTDGHLEITGAHFGGSNEWFELNGEDGGTVTVELYDWSVLHFSHGLTVASDGMAQLHLHDFTETYLEGGLIIGETDTADGLVTYTSSFRVEGSLTVGGEYGGSARLEDLDPAGMLMVKGDASVGPQGEMIVRGVIEGNLVNAGVVDPFFKGAKITVYQDYQQQESGKLVIDIPDQDDTSMPGISNRLAVGSSALLDGELSIVLEEGYTPTLGSEFVIMTYFQRQGRFAEITGDELAADEDMALAVLYDDEGIRLKAALIGDADFDGRVGLLDLDLVGANWGASDVDWRAGDFNNDGEVGLIDLDLLGGKWNGGTASSPEPTAATLLILTAAAVSGRRRRV